MALFRLAGRGFEWLVFLFSPGLWQSMFVWSGRYVRSGRSDYTVMAASGARVELSSTGSRPGAWFDRSAISPRPLWS
jgi:hypothetical protein